MEEELDSVPHVREPGQTTRVGRIADSVHVTVNLIAGAHRIHRLGTTLT